MKTVRREMLTMMERMTKKGLLTRKKIDNVFHYSPKQSLSEVLKNLVGDFVNGVLGGSVVTLAIVFVMLTSWLRAAEPTRVFIFAGQSNMLGADAKAEQIHEFPAYRNVATLREDVLFAYRLGNGDQASNGWVPLRALEAFGPEISFADEVTKHVEFPIAIIKSAVGGTTIAYDWHPEAPQPGQQLYPKTLALIRDALQELTDRGIDYRLEGEDAFVEELANNSQFQGLTTDPISRRSASSEPESPFGTEYPNLDSLATGKWWTKRSKGQNPPPSLDVPRDQTIAFALYTIDQDILSVSAQLFPLMPEETREVRLEILRGNKWVQLSRKPVNYPGWDVQFRIQPWDASQQVRYRILHGAHASSEGTFCRNPIDQESIVVASMSCNSSRTTGMRPEILEQLLKQNPDLLFLQVTKPIDTPSTRQDGSSSDCSFAS
ncbi:MAG: BlaI/MecI/CopY family transcriptional regulator [Planctomycetes bacterium]|nr:BlaI/MecI/CopY family transcriptional regulator [Planctomycetota bacterium]